MKIYWSGRYLNAAQAVVQIDGGYHEGTALAENMRVRAGRIVDLKEHGQRLCEAAGVLLVPLPDLKELGLASRNLLSMNHIKEGSLRIRYFRDRALLIQALPLKPLKIKMLRLMTSAVRHYGPGSLQGRLKANSMLPNWLAMAETKAWAEDGLRLTPDGFVAEGVWSNLLIEKKGVLLTPPLYQGVLEGITRAKFIRAWKAKRRPVKEWPLTRYDLYTADKIWICSSLRGALRVKAVDGRHLGN